MAQNYLTIKNVLETFSANHDELKRFKISFHEQLDNFSTENKEFPILYSEIQDVAFAPSEDIYTYRIYCLDIIQKDRSNQDTVLNTTSTILSDLTNWLRLNYEAPVVLLNEPRAFPVTNFLVDFTAGFYADFEFEVVGQKSDCVIPFANAFQFTGATCDVSYNRPWLTCATLPNCSYYIDLRNNSIVTNSFSATSFSAGTIYSGNTNLYDIFVTTNDGNDITRVQPGLNIYTGGTANNPTVNISAATLSSLSSVTISADTIYSGSTNLYDIFGTADVFLPTNQVAWGSSTSGVTGNTNLIYTQTGSLNQLTLSSIPVQAAKLRIETIGGAYLDLHTYNEATISSASLNINTASAISLGSQYTVTNAAGFYTAYHQTGVTINHPQPYGSVGLNPLTVVGKSFFGAFFPATAAVDISGSTSTQASLRIRSGVTVSSPYEGEIWNDGSHLYGNVGGSVKQLDNDTSTSTNIPTSQIAYGSSTSGVSASTFFTFDSNVAGSGTAQVTVGQGGLRNGQIEIVDAGGNILRLQTATDAYLTATAGIIFRPSFAERMRLTSTGLGIGKTPTYDLDVNGRTNTNSLSATSISATSIITDAFKVGNVTYSPGDLFYGGAGNKSFLEISDSQAQIGYYDTRTQYYNGSLANLIDGSQTLLQTQFLTTIKTDVRITGTTITSALSSTTISAITFYSGTTDLSLLFVTHDNNDVTRIGSGLNTYTGGTANNPTINISAATLTSVSASTISGGTIYSGSTDVSSLFAHATKIGVTSVGLQNLNISTGGTVADPTLLLNSSPSLNGIVLSGSGISARAVSFSATTLSGGTLFSGSTNLNTTFAHAGKIGVTSVGSANPNIVTGGTLTNPTLLLAGSPSLNGIVLSGSGISARALSFSATTLSGGTLYSGATDIYRVFSSETITSDWILLGDNKSTYTATSMFSYVQADNELKIFGGLRLQSRNQSGGTYSIQKDDYSIATTTNVDLPQCSSAYLGKLYTIKNAKTTGNITVQAFAGDLIDLNNTVVLIGMNNTGGYNAITIFCNGTQWYISSSHTK